MLPGWWGVGSVTALSALHPPARMISPSGNTRVWGAPLGLLFFRLLELNQHSYPMGPFRCLPHTPACALCPLSTVLTNWREGFGGEKNQPVELLAGEKTSMVMASLGLSLQPSHMTVLLVLDLLPAGLGGKTGEKSFFFFFLFHVSSLFSHFYFHFLKVLLVCYFLISFKCEGNS